MYQDREKENYLAINAEKKLSFKKFVRLAESLKKLHFILFV